MKKILFTLLFMCMSVMTFAQFRPGPGGQSGMPQRHFKTFVDMSKYEVVDSLPIERLIIFSPFDYEDDKVHPMGNGEYVIDAPHKDRMIIRKTKDDEKAIVVYNSYVFGRHKEFNIKENEIRMILWYQDDDIYCGYIYDKRLKVAKYFETHTLFNEDDD